MVGNEFTRGGKDRSVCRDVGFRPVNLMGSWAGVVDARTASTEFVTLSILACWRSEWLAANWCL